MNLSDNLLLNYFVAFWSGVLVSFSPCVYPVLPVTAGIIAGVNTTGTKLRGFVLSLVYVLGMAITFCTLAAVAAINGKIFGQFQNQPLVLLAVGNIFILFSLVLFDFIQISALGVNFQHRIKLRNIWSILLLGAAAGFVVGPCTAPVLGGLLALVASKQSLMYGVSLLFFFSYGVGASLILVGTFSGILSNLPKSGPWLLWIKKFCGLVLFVIGEYLIIKAGRLMG
jgi:thiol:disulfide interchange protein DsbD